MRYKIFVRINLVLVIVMLCAGVVFRMNVTNDYNSEAGRDNLCIAYYSSDLNDVLKKEKYRLPQSSIIIVAKALGNSEYVFDNLKQEVYVEKVIKGSDEVTEGKNAYIVGTGLRYTNELGKRSVNTNFLNFMQKGDRYLIFIGKKVDWDVEKDIDIYEMNRDSLTMQYLNLDRNQSSWDDTDQVYELYKNVKDMEFYANNEESLRIFNESKQKLIEEYCDGIIKSR